MDLASERQVRSINLGSASLTPIGQSVIGRLVSVEGGAVFDAAPLPVPECVAQSVAQEPASWVEIIARHPEIDRDWQDFSLLTDVPLVVQLVTASCWTGSADKAMGTVEEAMRRRLALVRAGIDDELAAGETDIAPYPSIAAALVEPNVLNQLARGLVPADAPTLLRFSELLVEPAADVCRRLARDVTLAA